MLVDRYFHGLRIDIQHIIAFKIFDNVDEIIQHTKAEDIANNQAQKFSASKWTAQKTPLMQDSKSGGSLEKVFTKPEGQSRITCFHYKQHGHRVMECPKRIHLIEDYCWALSWFDCCLVPQYSLKASFQAWSMGVGSAIGKIMWNTSFLAIIWTLWKERNLRCFKGVSSSNEAMAFKVKYLIVSWVSVLPNFRGYSIDDVGVGKRWRSHIPFFPGSAIPGSSPARYLKA